MVKNPVKQHTVPASYLRWFTDNPEKWRDSMIYVYDIKTKKTRYDKVSNVSIEKDFYTMLEPNWNKNYMFETKILAKIDAIPSIMNKISKREMLSPEDISNLSYFMVMQEMRSRSRRERDNKSENDLLRIMFREIIYNLKTRVEQELSLEKFLNQNYQHILIKNNIADIYNQIIEWKELDLYSNDIALKSMIHLANYLYKLLLSRPWIIHQVPLNRGFICSDYPLCLHREKDWFHWPWYWNAETILFPLTKRDFVVMYRPDLRTQDMNTPPHTIKKYMKLNDDKLIRHFNYLIAQWTNREVYSHNPKLLERVTSDIERRDAEYKRKKTMLDS